MIVVRLWVFVLAIIDWAHSLNQIRGASCVQVDLRVYVLSGQTSNNGWSPLEHTYTIDLEKADALDLAQVTMLKHELLDYTSQGIYTATTALYDKVSFYYISGDSLKLEDITIKSNTLMKNLASIVVGPQNSEHESDKSINYNTLPPGQLTLLTNDMRSNETILIGAEANLNSVSSYSVGVLEYYSKRWKSFSVPLINDKFYVAGVFRGFVYVFGPGVNINQLPNGKRLLEKGKSTLVLAKFSIRAGKWEAIISKGHIPSFSKRNSYTQHGQYMFLTGEENDSKGTIYVLNLHLSTPVWRILTQNNFTSYESGCLTFYGNNLYHYLGIGNPGTIQRANISEWNLDEMFESEFQNEIGNDNMNLDALDPYNESSSINVYPIILGSVGGSLTLSLIFVVFYHLWRRQRELKPPKICQDFVVCDPQLNPYENGFVNNRSTEISRYADQEHFRITELVPEESFTRRLSKQYLTTNKPNFRKI